MCVISPPSLAIGGNQPTEIKRFPLSWSSIVYTVRYTLYFQLSYHFVRIGPDHNRGEAAPIEWLPGAAAPKTKKGCMGWGLLRFIVNLQKYRFIITHNIRTDFQPRDLCIGIFIKVIKIGICKLYQWRTRAKAYRINGHRIIVKRKDGIHSFNPKSSFSFFFWLWL